MQLPSLLRGVRSGLACVALMACSTAEVQKPTTDEEDPSIIGESDEGELEPDDQTASADPADGGKRDSGARVDAGTGSGPAAQVDSGVRTDAGGGAAADAGTAVGGSDSGAAADSGGAGDGGSTAAGPGVCGGATPHGCYTPKAGNPMGCPPQIFEQSAFYPPIDEWKGCSSPFYEPCNYVKPEGGEANCSCDLGLHWLCTY